MQENFLEAGKIVNTHGIAGEVKVQPWCDSVEMLLEFTTLYWKNGTPVTVERSISHKGCAIMRLEGIDTMDKAQALRNEMLYFHRDDVILPDNLVFIRDILGFTVHDDRTDSVVGELRDVLTTNPAHDLYEIRKPDGKFAYVPAIQPFLQSVDMENRCIHIRSIEGLLDEN